MGPKIQTSHYKLLKHAWLQKHHQLHKKLWDKHKDSLNWLHHTSRHLMVSSLSGLILMSHPGTTSIIAHNLLAMDNTNGHVNEKKIRTKAQLIADLTTSLPQSVQPLNPEQETKIGDVLHEYFQLDVAAMLQGKRLNRSYGLIGAEQHLTRYPGDIMDSHFHSEADHKYWSSGMASGRGAWGYFADSRESMTEKDIQREKYYIAVPTFLSPGWNEDVAGHYAFFKFRKMLVVNPENGKAIVVVIGDAGPAEFTGKHLGGSPEVMAHLERVDGGARGPVLYYFINDPEDKVPLGPIDISTL